MYFNDLGSVNKLYLYIFTIYLQYILIYNFFLKLIYDSKSYLLLITWHN